MTRNAPPARGILRSPSADRGGEHQRILPREALAPFIAHFWSVSWSFDAPFTVETLPHPAVHVVFEDRSALISGVHSARFTRQLAGRGQVFGIKFRPAMFQPLLGGSMSSLNDRVVPIEEIFGKEGRKFARDLWAARTLDDKIALAERFLLSRVSAPPSEVTQIRDLVERIATDRSLLRAEDVASLAELDLRTLQRRFRRYIGPSPKWVIQRYRMHEAAERLKSPNPPALADLAAELGYFDQPHFARDFKQAIGRTPRQFSSDG